MLVPRGGNEGGVEKRGMMAKGGGRSEGEKYSSLIEMHSNRRLGNESRRACLPVGSFVCLFVCLPVCIPQPLPGYLVVSQSSDGVAPHLRSLSTSACLTGTPVPCRGTSRGGWGVVRRGVLHPTGRAEPMEEPLTETYPQVGSPIAAGLRWLFLTQPRLYCTKEVTDCGET